MSKASFLTIDCRVVDLLPEHDGNNQIGLGERCQGHKEAQVVQCSCEDSRNGDMNPNPTVPASMKLRVVNWEI